MNTTVSTHPTTDYVLDEDALEYVSEQRTHVIRHLEGSTTTEVADKLGVSPSYVNEIRTRVLPDVLVETDATHIVIAING